mgnify:CR=1 FL=1
MYNRTSLWRVCSHHWVHRPCGSRRRLCPDRGGRAISASVSRRRCSTPPPARMVPKIVSPRQLELGISGSSLAPTNPPYRIQQDGDRLRWRRIPLPASRAHRSGALRPKRQLGSARGLLSDSTILRGSEPAQRTLDEGRSQLAGRLSGCFALCITAQDFYRSSNGDAGSSGPVRRCTFYATLALLEGSVLACPPRPYLLR